MSCHICLPYFSLGFDWPNRSLMMKGNLGTPVSNSKHLCTEKNQKLENIWGHYVFYSNSALYFTLTVHEAWPIRQELLYLVTCGKHMGVCYMTMAWQLCSLVKLMLSIHIPLPSEGKVYSLSVRCSVSLAVGCFYRAPISTIRKQAVWAPESCPRGWARCRTPAWMKGKAAAPQQGQAGVRRTHFSEWPLCLRHTWAYLRTFSGVLTHAIMHFWKLNRKYFSICHRQNLSAGKFSLRELFHTIHNLTVWAAVRNQSDTSPGNSGAASCAVIRKVLWCAGKKEICHRNRWNLGRVLSQRAKYIPRVKTRQIPAWATCSACGFLRNERRGEKSIFSVPGSGCWSKKISCCWLPCSQIG